MVRVIIDHDLVTIPEPVIAEAVVGLGNTEEESAKPKTLGTASSKAEDMTLTDAARKSSMFKRPVDMVPGIVAARVMPDPLIVCMHVGSFRMSGFIRKTTALRRGRLLRSVRLLGAGRLLIASRLLGAVRLLGAGRLLSASRLLSAGRRRTVRRNVSTANTMHATAPLLAASILCGSRDRKDRQQYEQNYDCLQNRPP